MMLLFLFSISETFSEKNSEKMCATHLCFRYAEQSHIDKKACFCYHKFVRQRR